MDQFFCFCKKDFCDNHTACKSCELSDGEGGIYIEDFNKILVAFFGKDYEVDHLRELVEADRDRTRGIKMKRYTKKPVTVEAIQWTGKNLQDLKNFVGDSLEYDVMDAAWEGGKGPVTVNVRIQTLEGIHHASVGDFVIKGVHGEFYPCKPDIFQETYVEAEE